LQTAADRAGAAPEQMEQYLAKPVIMSFFEAVPTVKFL